MCVCVLYIQYTHILYTTRATADRDGGDAMTILRPLSVMTPGPGDPEVAYAKQGTSADREPVCGCTYMDKSRRQCIYSLYLYGIIYYILYRMCVCAHLTSAAAVIVFVGSI